MITIDDLAADRRTIDVTYRGTTFAVSWKPSAYTSEFATRVASGALRTCELLAELVDSWEVTEADGTTVAATVDRVAQLPLPFCQQVETALLNDLQLAGLPEASSGSAAG